VRLFDDTPDDDALVNDEARVDDDSCSTAR
jgi:hypothetical protein